MRDILNGILERLKMIRLIGEFALLTRNKWNILPSHDRTILKEIVLIYLHIKTLNLTSNQIKKQKNNCLSNRSIRNKIFMNI